MHIYGIEIKRDDLLKRIGDISQLGGIKSFKFNDGASKGIRALNIKNAAGIDITVLLDRCMDISSFFYKSTPFSITTPLRVASPAYFESEGVKPLRSFHVGFMTTCGLANVGYPCEDVGEKLGFHGRISNIPAEKVCINEKWENERYKMCICGKMRETAFFGNYLELTRKISVYMDEPKILIEDTVENLGYREAPLMILYHINMGYPVIDSNAKILVGKEKVITFDKESEKGINKCNEFSNPVAGFVSQVFSHDIEADESGNSNIALTNPIFNQGKGIGLWLKFNKENLPYMNQFKGMDFGEYGTSFEPANCFVRGRKTERENGKLKFIKPGKIISYRIEINILESIEDINSFKEKFCR